MFIVLIDFSFFFFQEPEILQAQSNEILTAIVHGMKKEETRLVLCFDCGMFVTYNLFL